MIVYWKKYVDGIIKVIWEYKRLALVEVWQHKLGEIYADGKLRRGRWRDWLGSLSEAKGLVEHWNAHN